MPIEFPCPACNSLLRTPDSSVGKKAKCPKCGAIAVVPEMPSSTAAPTSLPDSQTDNPFDALRGSAGAGPAIDSMPLPPGSGTANPFADASASPFAPQKPVDSYNPYASPAMTMDGFTPVAGPSAAMVPTRINFGDTLQATWKVFSENAGTLVLIALILCGLVVIGYVAIAGVVAAFVFATMNGGVEPVMLIVAIPVVLLLVVVALVVYSWIEAGLAIVVIGLCRGRQMQVGDMFSGKRFTLQVVILNILRGVINFAISFVCGMLGQVLAMAADEPAVAAAGSILANVINYIVTLLLLLTTYFIVDRNLDVIQSVSASMQYMRGNKLTVFLLHIVVGLCAVGVVLLTCGMGALLVMPYFMVLTAMIYLMATGQSIASYAGQKPV
ncbi:MAG: hypothetical protein KJ000_34250 [Pirellulaceae bacterium]|nr:hypothetical protein [Pirellulaceae bacterium]